MRLPLLPPTLPSSNLCFKRTFNRFSNNLSLRRNYGGSWRKCSNSVSDTPAIFFPFPLIHGHRSGKCFHQQCRTFLTAPVLHSEMVDVTFITGDGTKHKTKGKVGDNLLDVVVNNSVDLDGFGACEGTLACSTCHLVFKKKDFDKITDKITDEELDMLDLAYGLTDTSRLGCQVTLSKALAGVEVEVPAGVNDQRS